MSELGNEEFDHQNINLALRGLVLLAGFHGIAHC